MVVLMINGIKLFIFWLSPTITANILPLKQMFGWYIPNKLMKNALNQQLIKFFPPESPDFELQLTD
jgi:hypothetical protein